jgi:hypothetical protein
MEEEVFILVDSVIGHKKVHYYFNIHNMYMDEGPSFTDKIPGWHRRPFNSSLVELDNRMVGYSS